MRVFYPAAPTWSLEERMSGVLPADPAQAPFPVVVIAPGINVGQDSYRWLAVRLAEAGFLAVSYDHVGELMPGQVGTSPGVDLDAARPEHYGSRPTGVALRAVLDAVAAAAASGPLEGLVDLTRVAFVGQPGGSVAAVVLERLVPRAAGDVTMPRTACLDCSAGHHRGRLVATVPCCYGRHPRGCRRARCADGGPVEGAVADAADQALFSRTHEESLASSSDALMVLWRGANHFAVADPVDPTTARAFLDGDPVVDPAATREALTSLVIDFLRGHVRDEADARERVTAFVAAPPSEVSLVRRRTAVLTGRSDAC
jgi:dienelactone hydrolase